MGADFGAAGQAGRKSVARVRQECAIKASKINFKNFALAVFCFIMLKVC